jgi:4,5-dihydroxyphthalate decarboxylase
MKNLHLTLACEDYDRMRPLKDGIVKPEGIELNYLVMSVEEIFWRMMKYEEFDASELSMGAFLTAAARGRRPFVAIPVFPSRTFRHRCIFVNTDSGVKRIEDLRRKKMGVPEYSMTAAVWLRGMFEHEYGVPPSDIHWIQAGEEHPGRKDRVDFEMPAGVRMESRPDTTLNALIENGEIAAMMSPRMPTCFLQGSPKVQRLFPNYRQVEMEYFQKHRIVSDHARVGDQALDLRERAVGSADVVQSILPVQRNLHARSLRHQYLARGAAMDCRRV